MAGQVPLERSTKDGSVYGQDANAATTPKYETITFSRMYRHSIDVIPNAYAPETVPINRATNGAWKILPIQNAAIAAMRPRDWAALNNLACKWKIKSFGLNCSNWNAIESEATQNRVQQTTIPNIFMEAYVDHDHDLPGYEQDFLYTYGTNKLYTEGDGQSGAGADLGLRPYNWTNTSGSRFYPANELNLLNGNGYQFIKQTDNFDFHWDVPSGEQKWRHAGTPWQYQINPNEMAQGEAGYNPNTEQSGTGGVYINSRTSSTGSFPTQPNLAWGGFPTTARPMQRSGQLTTAVGTENNLIQGRADLSVKQDGQVGDCMVRPVGMLSNMGNQGASAQAEGIVGGPLNYWSAYDDACKNQISGVPISFTPPPLILLRTNIRAGDAVSHWEFFCKYYITIEYRRNQLGYFPMEQAASATSTWCGTGNLGFVTQPGANRMDPNRGPPEYVDHPYEYPGANGETWRPWNPPPVPTLSDVEKFIDDKRDGLRRSKRLAIQALDKMEGTDPKEKRKKKRVKIVDVDEDGVVSSEV